MDNLVKVIIPIYRTTLKDWERASLDNTLRLLSAYPILFLIPEGLDIRPLSTVYPSVEVMRVSPDWLGTRRGIAGYNEIYLKKDLAVSRKNDVKGVYRDNEGKTPIVGIDARFDEPQHPDLVLEVDKLSEEETFRAVLDYMEKKYGKGWEKEVRA